MRLPKPIVLFAILWAISLPSYLLHKLAYPDPVPGCVLYAQVNLWIGHDEKNQPQIILPSDPNVQANFEQLVQQSDYNFVYQFAPRASTRIFRDWDSVASPSFLRIYSMNGGPVDHNEILMLILTEAEAALAQPNPPYEYIELRDHGILDVIRTNSPVVFKRYPVNIALDLLTLAWGAGSIILASVFIGVLLSRLQSDDNEQGCQFCNYAIDGLPSAICPECGQNHTAPAPNRGVGHPAIDNSPSHAVHSTQSCMMKPRHKTIPPPKHHATSPTPPAPSATTT